MYLTNTYASTTNPADFEFDRVLVQAWGDASDLIGLTYAPVRPSIDNGGAVTKTWMNDRVGRVSEHYFDDENQLVMVRDHTGFVDPDLPTDDTNNRPTRKLRASDPDYFEQRFAYNAGGHVTLEVHPRGNATQFVYEGDVNPSASTLVSGNLRESHRHGQSCDSGFQTITERFQYVAGRGNEHGSMNFVTRSTDPRGNATQAEYDSAGNRTATIYAEPDTREDMEYSAVGQLTRHIFAQDQHGQRREIEYTYANNGHLREKTEDPGGLDLLTTREFDAACNETRRVDARGYDTLFTYNEQGLLVREQSPLQSCSQACGGGTAWRDNTDRIYDANKNLVRVDYQALDCDGRPQTNAVVSTTYEHDILNELLVTRSEIVSGEELVEDLQLDANREVVVLRYGEAVARTDPFNIVTKVYDERGKIFRETQGDGSVFASTTQHDYDGNGNETVVYEGLEGSARTTTNTYDCADRVTATVDPMGNRTESDYDIATNVQEQRFYGELIDVPRDEGNVLIERSTMVYDRMNRPVETTRSHFDPATQAPIGDGSSVTSIGYDGESRVVAQSDDLGNRVRNDFDAAGRHSQTIDEAGNVEDRTFDAVGNVLTRTQTDVPSIYGTPRVGVWTQVYGADNNATEVRDPAGSTTHNCYDSLGNLVTEIDARGNHTLHTYDGAGRLLETTHLLTDDGTGSGTVVGTAVTSQTWDDSNRLVSRRDPNGNATQYAYDPLQRLTSETFADGTQTTYSYDVHGNVLVQEDANVTVLTMTYDALDRPTQVDVDPGPMVATGATFESYAYQARSLLAMASDDDSVVSRSYDSLGELVSETQTYQPVDPTGLPATPYTISYARDGVGNAVTTRYPSGRELHRKFDGRRRASEISEGARKLVKIDYLGPNVLARQYLPPDLRSEYAYDLARRMTESRHRVEGGATIDHREYGFDASGNKVSEQDLALGSLTGVRLTEHDSLDRSVVSQVNGSSATDRSVAYALDGAGNRKSVSGDRCPGAYTQTDSDALVHQYTDTPCESWSHDDAGNLLAFEATAPGGRDLELSYDHRGRVVDVLVNRATAGEVALRFAYDALGRKVHEARTTPSGVVELRFTFDGGDLIEEYRSGEPQPIRTYVYGDGLDERLQMVAGAHAWWFFHDELGSTTALVRRSASGPTLIERYAYEDYGAPTFFYQGSEVAAPPSGNPYLFTGARWLEDAGLYGLRTRHLDTLTGRFTSRDSIGNWGDEENLGNGYTYVGNGPETHTDPTGEAKAPHILNCMSGARDAIEDALVEAENMARAARDEFNRQSDRTRKIRKRSWNNRENDNRRWWGKYQNTRFHRIKWNFRKIVRRCSENTITFMCRDSGLCGGDGATRAWTLSHWHAWMRLCRNGGQGFFGENGQRRFSATTSGSSIVHEVSHNINAVGDKRLNGTRMRTPGEVQKLAIEKPIRASWNANNYQDFALDK